MIQEIHADEACHAISAGSLEEEGVSVEIGSSLLDQRDEPLWDKVAILKPDLFYSTTNFATPPKCVDGIIVIEDESGIRIYVAELKSSRSSNIKRRDIQSKFDTIFQKFLTNDFSHIFEALEYNLIDIKLWLVCDPLQIRRKSPENEEYIRKVKILAERLRGLLSEMSVGYKPYKYKGIQASIQPLISPPTIEIDGYTDHLAV